MRPPDTRPDASPDAALVPPSFLPWLRTGLAAQLGVVAVAGLAPLDATTVAVGVRVRASGPDAETTRTVDAAEVRLTGPADVVAVDPAQVLRTDPQPGATYAEPYYLAQVELAAPDLPWRFTPAAADQDGRLQPWLALVVVEDRDGVRLDPAVGGRLPILHVDDAVRELPDLTGCWAWAHVHADHDLADGVANALAEAPDAFRSRLLCPRRLTPATSWIACVVPTFAAGRQAGLGEPVTASGLAWSVPAAGEVVLPVYYSWCFSTGPQGDVESLVRRLRPRELPGDVGRRDLDLSDPGGGLPAVAGAVVSYAGALVSPGGRDRPWPDPHRAAMTAALRRAVNARLPAPVTDPDPYDALEDDPIVGPTAYASAQAGRRAVPADGAEPLWFGMLNTDPRHRVVGGLGTEVVRADAEALMAAAWRHAAGLRDVNRTLCRARLAWEVGNKLRPRVLTLDDATLLQLAGPALPRLAYPGGGTVRGAVTASDLPDGLFTGAFRRVTRTARAFTGPATEGGARRSLTSVVTAAAIASPAGFAAAWRTRTVIPGTEVSGPLPDAGPLVVGPGHRPLPPRARGLVAAPVDLGLVDAVRDGLDPAATVRAMVDARVVGLPTDRDHDVPPRWRAEPDIVTPMASRLVARSVEFLVPGSGRIPDDTVGLLEVNQLFVEAFLAGVNQEVWREFLWREFPARPGATWARHFWDTGPGGPADVPPLGTWLPDTRLGDHRPGTAPDANLVLLVKGALPRRYPDLRVYAVQAEWTPDGTRRERPGGQVRLPVLAGRLQPDTAFWGFALTRAQARGTPDPDAHAPGWFLVLEQRPGATRFGLDAARAGQRGTAPARWSNLSWAHLAPAGDGPLPSFADPFGPPWLIAAGARHGNGGPGRAGLDAWGEDAAAMARITLQRPVRLLVHASAMLPPTGRADREADQGADRGGR